MRRAADLLGDRTVALLLDGYEFVSERCDASASDILQTRLLLEPAICLRGREAAEVFYDVERFQRAGALPGRVQRTLLGTGSVMVLDDEAHRERKSMLLGVMTPDSVERLARLFRAQWRAALPRWSEADEVVLLHEAGMVLCRAVCEWAGVPLPEEDVARRTSDLHALIDAPAALGPRHWRGLLARRRAERWIGGLVDEVRSGSGRVPQGSALYVVAMHRDPDGRLLDRHTAAVEVLNLLRPTVAIDRFVVFLAHALHIHGEWAPRLRDDPDLVEPFVQEVRRFYPFFPMTAARVRADFEWQGVHFTRGRRVMLDLYGTNRHPGLWHSAHRFDPTRFAGHPVDPFELVPQGGGDHWANHRCAGEWVTIAVMREALRALTRDMRYVVPPQDLRISLRRIPAVPRSRMRLSEVASVGSSE